MKNNSTQQVAVGTVNDIFNDVQLEDEYSYMELKLSRIFSEKCYETGITFLDHFFSKLSCIDDDLNTSYVHQVYQLSDQRTSISLSSSRNIVISMFQQWFSNIFDLDIELSKGMFRLIVTNSQFCLYLDHTIDGSHEMTPIFDVRQIEDISGLDNPDLGFDLFINIPYNPYNYMFDVCAFDAIRGVNNSPVECDRDEPVKSQQRRGI